MSGLACLYIIKLVMHLATKSICPKKYAGTIWIVYKIFFEGILKMQMGLWEVYELIISTQLQFHCGDGMEYAVMHTKSNVKFGPNPNITDGAYSQYMSNLNLANFFWMDLTFYTDNNIVP